VPWLDLTWGSSLRRSANILSLHAQRHIDLEKKCTQIHVWQGGHALPRQGVTSLDTVSIKESFLWIASALLPALLQINVLLFFYQHFHRRNKSRRELFTLDLYWWLILTYIDLYWWHVASLFALWKESIRIRGKEKFFKTLAKLESSSVFSLAKSENNWPQM
jgi:hypothetical protein